MSSLSAQSRAVADRFEDAWQSYHGGSSGPPTLDAYLAEVAVPERAELFRALLRADLGQRLRHGFMPSIRYYLHCFPEYGDDIRKTFDVPFRLDRLGRGGMGEVYRAFDFVARRPMAVKMIRSADADPDTIDPVALQRFYAEARAVALLQHPNIVQVYHVGHEDEVPCLYMELVEGGSLAARVKEGVRDPRQAAALVEAIAHGVQHAHEHDIVHRDLKPANVLLAADGTPKVTDFGLAKLGDASCHLTRTGAVMGTPDYMAPEQAEGRSQDIGPASDVWALGGILYALLTGRPPFRDVANDSIQEILRKVCHAAPTPPRLLRRDVPADLEVICLKCLEKLPGDRYGSARELADDLHRFCCGESIHARPVGLAGRAWRWGLKNKAVTVAASAVALLLLATGGLLGLAALLYLVQGVAVRSREDAAKSSDKAIREQINALQDRGETLLRAAEDEADARDALDRIAEAVELRKVTQERLTQLAPPDPAFAADHEDQWQKRWVRLRNEATRRLTRTELREVRSVSLPGPAADEIRLGAAVSPDGSWLVLGYAGDSKLRVIGREPGEPRMLTFPREVGTTKTVFGMTGAPALAVSPGGLLIAVLYPQADELVVIGPGGDGFRTIPLPAGLGRSASPFAEKLRFTAEDRIEVDEAGLTWVLPLRDGKWEPPARGSAPPRETFGLPGLRPGAGMKRVVGGPEYTAEWDLSTDTVHVQGGGRSRLVWRGATLAADGERCSDVRFGAQSRHLYLLTTKRLLLVDAATGAQAEKSLGGGGLPGSSYRQAVFPWRGGVTLLRQAAGDQLVVVFLTGTTAEVPVPSLAHPGPVRALDLAADGLLVTAAERQVHVWRGQQSLRAYGSTAGGPAGFDARKPSVQNLSAWWGFLPGQRPRLVAERPESPQGGIPFAQETLVRTEVYDSEDGRLLHTFPARGAGRIVRPSSPFSQAVGVSPDRRFAVVVARENGRTATLELWSLDECRSLAPLGEFTLSHEGLLPALGLIFSPQGRWLLTIQHPAATALGRGDTAAVGFWRLPEGKRTGGVAFPIRGGPAVQFGCHFDAAEGRLLLTEMPFGGGAGAEGSPAWVVDLDAGTKRCTLEDFETRGAGTELFLAGDHLIVRGRSTIRNIPGAGQEFVHLPCSVWNLSTGRRTDLGKPWGQPPSVELSPDGRRAVLHGLLKAPVGFGGIAAASIDVQLWDLTEPKLLREASLALVAAGGGAIGGLAGDRVGTPIAGDRDHAYFAVQGETPGARPRTVAWRWSDGADVKRPGTGVVVASSATEGWLLWSGDGKTSFTDRAAGTMVELETARDASAPPRLSPDRKTVFLAATLAAGSGFWDTRTGKLLVRLPEGHEFADFDATGRWAVTRDRERGVALLDLRGGPPRRLELPLKPDRNAAAPAVGGGIGGNVRPGFPVAGLEGRPTIQVRPDGARLALSVYGDVLLWDVSANRPVGQVQTSGHAEIVNAVAQHAGKGLIASAGADRIIHLWERGGERQVRQLIGHTGPITALAFRPDGETLVSASEDGTVVLWRMDGTTVWTRRLSAVRCLAVPTHGRFLACGTGDARILLLDPESGATRAEAQTDGSEVLALALSRGGEVLASGTAKGQVAVWSLGGGLERMRAWDAGEPVSALAWLPTRNVLLTGGQSVRFWEMRSADGTPPDVWTLRAGNRHVRAMAVSESGRELFAADDGGQVAQFDLHALSGALRKWNLELPGVLP